MAHEEFKKIQGNLKVSVDNAARATMAKCILTQYMHHEAKFALSQNKLADYVIGRVVHAIDEMEGKAATFLPASYWNKIQNELVAEIKFLFGPITATVPIQIKRSFVAQMPKTLIDETEDEEVAKDSESMRALMPAKEDFTTIRPVELSATTQMYADGYYELVAELARKSCSDPWFKTI